MRDSYPRTRITDGRDPRWKWQVSGYASNQHRRYPQVKHGDLLVQTVHETDASKDLEIAAWQSRMDREPSEVAYVIVINKWTHHSETIYPKARGRAGRNK